MIDFSDCKLSGIYYGGSERKKGVIYKGSPYILKFRKDTPFGQRNNDVCEYIGSHIFNMLGIEAQVTLLGLYNGERVVACKDFVSNEEKFVPFNDVGESSLDRDKEKYTYSYLDIIELIEANKKLTNIQEEVETFFDIFVVDALIGNFDRHGGNWGFIKENELYRQAPIFDNGSCLYPNIVDESQMEKILNDKELINERIYKFPRSQILLHGEKSSYFDVISSLEFEECNKALERIYKRIDMDKIKYMIDNIDILSNTEKNFYKVMLKERYEKIIKYSYEQLKEQNYERD